ncbi:MAG: hypothetical protein ACJAT4_001722, partial [Granulosicoccus sp.]
CTKKEEYKIGYILILGNIILRSGVFFQKDYSSIFSRKK